MVGGSPRDELAVPLFEYHSIRCRADAVIKENT